MLAAILRHHAGTDAVLATTGNLNNDIGVPLTLLRLRPAHRWCAIELGMNHKGEIAYLAGIARPTVALVNNAQREHQEFMKSIADVALEHAALVRALRDGGTAVVNADDPSVEVWRAAARARPGVRVVDFALAHPAAIRLRNAPTATDAMRIETPGGDATLIVNAPSPTPAMTCVRVLACPAPIARSKSTVPCSSTPALTRSTTTLASRPLFC